MCDSETPFEYGVDEAAAFPGPTDKLFPDTPGARDASLSRSTRQDWYDYTTGYKEAADILVAHIEATGRQYDKLGYPILFLYRQHLELVVKNLIRACWNVLGRDADFPKKKLDLTRFRGEWTAFGFQVAPMTVHWQCATRR